MKLNFLRIMILWMGFFQLIVVDKMTPGKRSKPRNQVVAGRDVPRVVRMLNVDASSPKPCLKTAPVGCSSLAEPSRSVRMRCDANSSSLVLTTGQAASSDRVKAAVEVLQRANKCFEMVVDSRIPLSTLAVVASEASQCMCLGCADGCADMNAGADFSRDAGIITL